VGPAGAPLPWTKVARAGVVEVGVAAPVVAAEAAAAVAEGADDAPAVRLLAASDRAQEGTSC